VNRFPTTSVRCSKRGPTATSARSLGRPRLCTTRLHRLAHYYLKREQAGHSLQKTALVNEAYMRLVDYTRMQWDNRAHFMAAAAQAMRRILVDHARRRNAKRGANAEHVSLDAEAVLCADRSDDFGAWMMP
jgi:RNA polymerase sigma factor (TIGR02999 family)